MQNLKYRQEQNTLELHRILEGCFSFNDAKQRLVRQAGLSAGAAIQTIARLKPHLYNEFRRAGT